MKKSAFVVVLFSFFQIRTLAEDKVVPIYPGEIPYAKTPDSYIEIKDTARGYFTNVSFKMEALICGYFKLLLHPCLR